MGAVSFLHSHFYHRKHISHNRRRIFFFFTKLQFPIQRKINDNKHHLPYKKMLTDSFSAFNLFLFSHLFSSYYKFFHSQYSVFFSLFSLLSNFLFYVQFFFDDTQRAHTAHLTKHTHNTEPNLIFSVFFSHRNGILLHSVV